MKRFGVVMAGGNGVRLWPLSREKNPKQIVGHFGDKTLLERTIERIENIFSDEEIIVSVNCNHVDKIEAVRKGKNRQYEIMEQPYNRNNAPFILYIAMKIVKRYGNGVMCLLPSDHIIQDGKSFEEDLRIALDYACKYDKIVAIGTSPEYPAETYGYIRLDSSQEGKIKVVREFKEKPSKELAEKYIARGDYFWNSGVYVLTAETALECFKRFLPKVYSSLEPMWSCIDTDLEKEMLRKLYFDVQDISIDHGIMEQTDQLYAMKGSFKWLDVGSYDSLSSFLGKDIMGNVVKGRYIGVESHNNIIFSGRATVTTSGVEDTIVVVEDDVVFVCKRDRAAGIRMLVEKIRHENRTDIL
jgi:mannose-1-phosphate guanylyltransferase